MKRLPYLLIFLLTALTACQLIDDTVDFRDGRTLMMIGDISVYFSSSQGSNLQSPNIQMGSELVHIDRSSSEIKFEGPNPNTGMSRLSVNSTEGDRVWIQIKGLGGASVKAHLPDGKSLMVEYLGQKILILRQNGNLKLRLP